MTPRTLPLVLLLVAPPLAAVTAADVASAQRAPSGASERAEAAKLKKEGDAAMLLLHYGEALSAYDKAYDIGRDPALFYNRGRALQGLGRFPEALEQLEDFRKNATAQLRARVPALDALIEEVAGRVSTLTLTCNVEGARIILGDKVVGTTPFAAPLRLNAGSMVVQIEAEGYVPFRHTIALPGGGALTVDAELAPKSTKGVLVVRSPVAGARVSVDGKVVGDAPVEISVTAGQHRILIERDGFTPATTAAVVVVGGRKEVTVPLSPNPSVFARWWFWAGVGAVVATGAVVTAALLTERSADKGTIAPGQALAPFRF